MAEDGYKESRLQDQYILSLINSSAKLNNDSTTIRPFNS